MKPTTDDIVELSHLCATYASRMTQGDIDHVIAHLMTRGWHLQRVRGHLRARGLARPGGGGAEGALPLR